MCDPFACVRPMCPVCVPAPPGIFLPTFYRCVSRLPSPPRSLFTDTSTSGRRLLSRPRIRSSRGRAGVSVGLYGCEVRLCDPCARVVSRGVPAPPVSFYRYFFSIFVQDRYPHRDFRGAQRSEQKEGVLSLVWPSLDIGSSAQLWQSQSQCRMGPSSHGRRSSP